MQLKRNVKLCELLTEYMVLGKLITATLRILLLSLVNYQLFYTFQIANITFTWIFMDLYAQIRDTTRAKSQYWCTQNT